MKLIAPNFCPTTLRQVVHNFMPINADSSALMVNILFSIRQASDSSLQSNQFVSFWLLNDLHKLVYFLWLTITRNWVSRADQFILVLVVTVHVNTAPYTSCIDNHLICICWESGQVRNLHICIDNHLKYSPLAASYVPRFAYGPWAESVGIQLSSEPITKL